MKHAILDDSGNVIGGIVADEAFMEEHYPGRYRLIEEAPEDPPRIRRIRQDAFLDRFTFTEQVRIMTSNDPVVKVFQTNAITIKRPYIDLDHTLVQQAMPYLRDNSLLDGETLAERQDRMDAILSDGTQGET